MHRMAFSSLCEVLAATHLSYFVRSAPVDDLGGLMLCAPSGHLKTTAAEILSEFERTLVISDLTVKSLVSMRGSFLGGQVRTLIFSDYAKIYKRHGSVSSNIEGIIMALASEGFRKPAFSDQRIQTTPARAVIVGCMTPEFKELHDEEWENSGFLRRFLWSYYHIDRPEFLEDALAQWRKAELDGDFTARVPLNHSIRYSLTEAEVAKVRHSLRSTSIPDKKISLVLALKILCVLKWKFAAKDEEKPMRIWDDFAQSLEPLNDTILDVKEAERKK
jgi:hypothetical protein